MNNERNTTKPLESSHLTVDLVVLTIEDGQLKVLLTKRENEPFINYLALPGGYLAKDETAADAANRVLHNKAGINNVYVEQLYTFDDPKRDPRGRTISLTYFALAPSSKFNQMSASAELISVDKVGNLAFDHKLILKYAVERVQAKLGYTNIAYSLLANKFTLSELQSVYEVILGRTIDKRNFRKKIMSLDMLNETNEMQTGRKHRPARLYSFKHLSKRDFDSPFVWS